MLYLITHRDNFAFLRFAYSLWENKPRGSPGLGTCREEQTTLLTDIQFLIWGGGAVIHKTYLTHHIIECGYTEHM